MQPKKETAVSKPTSRFGTTDTSRKTTRKPASRPASAHRDAPGKPARRFSPQAAFVVGGILIVVAIAMLLMNTCGGFKATIGSIELDYGRVDVADNEVKVVVNQNTSRGYEWLYELEGDAATLKAGETEHAGIFDGNKADTRTFELATTGKKGTATLSLLHARTKVQPDNDVLVTIEVTAGAGGNIEKVEVEDTNGKNFSIPR